MKIKRPPIDLMDYLADELQLCYSHCQRPDKYMILAREGEISFRYDVDNCGSIEINGHEHCFEVEGVVRTVYGDLIVHLSWD